MKYIMIHGLGQKPDSWEKVIAQLGEVEVLTPAVITFYKGKTSTKYEDLYSGFAEYCDAQEGKLNLCGLSLGAILAMQYAMEHPEKVASLALIAGQYKMPKFLLKFQNRAYRMLPESAFAEMGFRKAGFMMLTNSMMKLDFRSRMQELRCKTLVLCGEKDRANKKAAKGMAEQFADARLFMVPGAGHEVNVEAPELLAEQLKAFWEI